MWSLGLRKGLPRFKAFRLSDFSRCAFGLGLLFVAFAVAEGSHSGCELVVRLPPRPPPGLC